MSHQKDERCKPSNGFVFEGDLGSRRPELDATRSPAIFGISDTTGHVVVVEKEW